MINLRKKDQDTLCHIAENCFTAPVEIWAYGSRTNGNSHAASDLDIVIRTFHSRPANWHEQMDFQQRIKKSNIPILVQAFDWGKLPDNFRNNILENHEVLFSNLNTLNATPHSFQD